MRSETGRFERLRRSRRIWAAAPIAIVVFALLVRGVLDLAGAECIYPNTPNSLDGEADCNTLGSISDAIGWLWPLGALIAIPGSAVLFLMAIQDERRAAARRARMKALGSRR